MEVEQIRGENDEAETQSLVVRSPSGLDKGQMNAYHEEMHEAGNHDWQNDITEIGELNGASKPLISPSVSSQYLNLPIKNRMFDEGGGILINSDETATGAGST